MYQLFLLVHVFICIGIIALVLVQQGKGATMGAAFGSGASQTVFGSRGSGSFLFRITIGFMVVFFATSIVLNYLAMSVYKSQQDFSLPVAPSTVKTQPVKNGAIKNNAQPAANKVPIRE